MAASQLYTLKSDKESEQDWYQSWIFLHARKIQKQVETQN